MWQLLSRWRRNRYTLIDGTVEAEHVLYRWNSLPKIVVSMLILTCVALVSFIAGQRSEMRDFQSAIKLQYVPEVFRYNRTFSDRPSNRTNDAWKALFPTQGGFFKHPTVAPTRSAFAVFHQLHCLNSIREGYWAVHDAAAEGHRIEKYELPMMISPPHIRHCIELLRHALMCQADITIEEKDMETGGVTGFGTQHQCRDWYQLVKWTSKWETYHQDPKESTNVSHHHQG